MKNIQFGKLYLITAAKPYYCLEVCAAEDKEKNFKIVKFTPREFHNHTSVRNKLMVELRCVIAPVKRHEWEEKLTELLPTVEDKEPEISELPKLHKLLNSYLTHGNVKKSSPSFIKPNEVYLANDVYYFHIDGFLDYLRCKKARNRTNLYKKLESYGCYAGEIQYTKRDGTTGTIKCWKKNIDNSLLETAKHYKDIRDSDAKKIAENRLDKHDSEELLDEEPWFVEKGTIHE